MTFVINNLDNIILNSQINENIAEHYLTNLIRLIITYINQHMITRIRQM